MNIACPQCSSVYRVDPARIPHGGITAACRQCGTALRVEPGDTAPGEIRAAAVASPVVEPGTPAAPAIEAPAEPAAQTPPEPVEDAASAPAAKAVREPAAAPGTPVFGPQDPETRAKRLARALVSDIVVYNPEKWEESRSAGTLRSEFRDEILKSWEEYVDQVGEEMAKKSPYFRDALNAILAEGKRVF